METIITETTKKVLKLLDGVIDKSVSLPIASQANRIANTALRHRALDIQETHIKLQYDKLKQRQTHFIQNIIRKRNKE